MWPSFLSAGLCLIVHHSWTGSKLATTANNWRWTVMNLCPLWDTNHDCWCRKPSFLKLFRGHFKPGNTLGHFPGQWICLRCFVPLRGYKISSWPLDWGLFKNSKLRDKEEPVTGMLTGANRPGQRCGKYQSVCSGTGTCSVSLGRQTRQHQCVKEMTSVTHSRGPVERGRLSSCGTDNVLSVSALISHHKWIQYPLVIPGCEKFRSCLFCSVCLPQ